MIVEIKNKYLQVGINSFGAELEYIKVLGVNILWQRQALWQEQCPILFPNIGALKDNYYICKDKKYEGYVHGFAKLNEFKILKHTESSITLALLSDDSSLKVFPFNFSLAILFEVVDKTLNCQFFVTNLDSIPLYFALGIHPGYAYSGLNKLLGNYYLQFKENNYESIDFNLSYIAGSHKELLNKLSLEEMSKKLVQPRTLCYKDLKIIDLVGDSCSIRIKHDMPYTAFWQKKPEDKAEFLCIEGWCGLPDVINTNHIIETKKTLLPLKQNSNFKTYYSITYSENGIL